MGCVTAVTFTHSSVPEGAVCVGKQGLCTGGAPSTLLCLLVLLRKAGGQALLLRVVIELGRLTQK